MINCTCIAQALVVSMVVLLLIFQSDLLVAQGKSTRQVRVGAVGPLQAVRLNTDLHVLQAHVAWAF